MTDRTLSSEANGGSGRNRHGSRVGRHALFATASHVLGTHIRDARVAPVVLSHPHMLVVASLLAVNDEVGKCV